MAHYKEKCACKKPLIEHSSEHVYVECADGCKFRFHIKCWNRKTYKHGGTHEKSKKEKFKKGNMCENSKHKTRAKKDKAPLVKCEIWKLGKKAKTIYDLQVDADASIAASVEPEILEAGKKIFYEATLQELSRKWVKKSGRKSGIFQQGNYTMHRLSKSRGGKEYDFYITSLDERWASLNDPQKQKYCATAQAELKAKEKKNPPKPHPNNLAKPKPPPKKKREKLARVLKKSPAPAPKRPVRGAGMSPLKKSGGSRLKRSSSDGDDHLDDQASQYILSGSSKKRNLFGGVFEKKVKEKKFEEKAQAKPKVASQAAFPGLKRPSKQQKKHSEIHTDVAKLKEKRNNAAPKDSWASISGPKKVSLANSASGSDRPPRNESGLPHPWQPVTDQESGDVYYWNIDTDEVTWDKPGGQPQLSEGVASEDRPQRSREASPNVALSGADSSKRSTFSSPLTSPGLQSETNSKYKDSAPRPIELSTGGKSCSAPRPIELNAHWNRPTLFNPLSSTEKDVRPSLNPPVSGHSNRTHRSGESEEGISCSSHYGLVDVRSSNSRPPLDLKDRKRKNEAAQRNEKIYQEQIRLNEHNEKLAQESEQKKLEISELESSLKAAQAMISEQSEIINMHQRSNEKLGVALQESQNTILILKEQRENQIQKSIALMQSLKEMEVMVDQKDLEILELQSVIRKKDRTIQDMEINVKQLTDAVEQELRDRLAPPPPPNQSRDRSFQGQVPDVQWSTGNNNDDWRRPSDFGMSKPQNRQHNNASAVLSPHSAPFEPRSSPARVMSQLGRDWELPGPAAQNPRNDVAQGWEHEEGHRRNHEVSFRNNQRSNNQPKPPSGYSSWGREQGLWG